MNIACPVFRDTFLSENGQDLSPHGAHHPPERSEDIILGEESTPDDTEVHDMGRYNVQIGEDQRILVDIRLVLPGLLNKTD